MSERFINSALRRFINKERRDHADKNGNLIPTRKELFSQFKASEHFQELYASAGKFYRQVHTQDELTKDNESFAGAVFEWIAYSYLKDRFESDNCILLPPLDTLEVYRLLFPNARLALHRYENYSLYGYSVPDGLLIKEDTGKHLRIKAVFEYSLFGEEDHFAKKYYSFHKDRQKFPELFSEAFFLIATPSTRNHFEIESNPDVQSVYLPFTHGQFRNFTDGLRKNYSPVEDGATLMDFQDRKGEELDRRIQLIGSDIFGLIYWPPSQPRRKNG